MEIDNWINDRTQSSMTMKALRNNHILSTKGPELSNEARETMGDIIKNGSVRQSGSKTKVYNLKCITSILSFVKIKI